MNAVFCVCVGVSFVVFVFISNKKKTSMTPHTNTPNLKKNNNSKVSIINNIYKINVVSLSEKEWEEADSLPLFNGS